MRAQLLFYWLVVMVSGSDTHCKEVRRQSKRQCNHLVFGGIDRGHVSLGGFPSPSAGNLYSINFDERYLRIWSRRKLPIGDNFPGFKSMRNYSNSYRIMDANLDLYK